VETGVLTRHSAGEAGCYHGLCLAVRDVSSVAATVSGGSTAHEESSLIEVTNLTKYYGQRAAIHDLSFSVKQGEILGLLGPNGAGKTTTMRILTGYMPPSAGIARVAGYDAFKDSLKLRQHIGYLPERVPLYEDMTVTAYLRYAGRIHGMAGKAIAERLDELLQLCHVVEFRDRLIGKLSRGQRQRVGIAQALIHDPEVVVLDEPTVGLDPRQIIETRALIKSLAGRHTVVLSTHILPEVSVVASEVVIIHEGHVIAQDTPQNLTARLQAGHSYRLVVRGPVEAVRKALAGQPGVTSVEARERDDGTAEWVLQSDATDDLREGLAAMVVGKGWGLRELATLGMSLEDIYLKLTTEEATEAA
jgi:ABC-2 type transport system ATP-binding protein